MADSQAEALLEERRGYLVRGLKDRAAQVDAELKRLGLEADDTPEPEPEPEEAPDDPDDVPETAVEAPPENAKKPRGRPRKAG